MLPVWEKWPFPEGVSQSRQFTRTFSKKRPGVERPERLQDCSTLELDQQASPAEDHTAGLYPLVVNSPPSIPHATMWARPVSQPTTGRYPHMALAPSTVEMEIDEPGPLSITDVPIVNSPFWTRQLIKSEKYF